METTSYWVDAFGQTHQIQPPSPSTPASDPDVTVVAKIDFYRRATDEEVRDISTALGAQSPRIQAIFRAAVNFRSDAEEWPLLQAAAVGLFGEARAAELLAPSA